MEKGSTSKKLILAIALSIGGFLIALLGNMLVPQIADVSFDEYIVGIFMLTGKDAYDILLIALIIVYLITGIRGLRRAERRKKYVFAAPFRFACGIALFLWDLLGTKLQILQQPFFPGPAGIMTAFVQEGPFIWQNTLYSLRLYLFGFLIGTAVGVFTGTLIGWFSKADYWVSPVLKVAGVIPSVAWMPFALTIFPTAFSGAVFLIVISVWFQVTTLTASGVKSTPRTLLEAARTLGANNRWLVFHIALPNALPNIFTGIMTANAFAFTILVMAEMMGQPGGLGYYINASKVWSAYYKVFAAIIVMAILFSLITKLQGCIEKRVLRWQKGVLK